MRGRARSKALSNLGLHHMTNILICMAAIAADMSLANLARVFLVVLPDMLMLHYFGAPFSSSH